MACAHPTYENGHCAEVPCPNYKYRGRPMKIGTRVTSTISLGAVRPNRPNRFAATVPKGSVGTVVEYGDLPKEPGWFAVQFDAPNDAVDGDPILVATTTEWVRVWP